MSRWARKVDTSDPAITATLRQLGFAVRDLSRQGGGCPDKIAALPDGRIWLVECKSKGTQHGKRLHLSDSQQKWQDGWPVPVVVLRSADEAAEWAMSARMPEKAPSGRNAGQPTSLQPCGAGEAVNRS